jgi:hypothetical protein
MPLIASSSGNLSSETADSEAEPRNASSSSTLYAGRTDMASWDWSWCQSIQSGQVRHSGTRTGKTTTTFVKEWWLDTSLATAELIDDGLDESIVLGPRFC